MSSKRIFIIIAVVSFILVSISSLLLLKKNVGGFDSLFTSQNDCTPYNLVVEKGDEEFSVRIIWQTRGKCLGFVQYGLDRSDLDRVGMDLNNVGRSEHHEVVIEKLLTKQKYFYLINSDKKGYGNNGAPLEFILGDL